MLPSSRVLLAAVLALAAACASAPPLFRQEPEGLAALPDDVRYVALGDSIAAGTGATTNYVDEFARRVEAELGRNVDATNLARGDWTTGDLLDALRNDGAVREAVARADVITWNIGGNDLLRVLADIATGTCGGERFACVPPTVDTVKRQWDAIVAEIVGLRRDEDVVLRTIDLYHPFVAEHRQAGLFEALVPFLDEVNAHLAATSDRHGIRVAAVHDAFNAPGGSGDPAAKGLLAADGVHPSDAGHALIAELLLGLG